MPARLIVRAFRLLRRIAAAARARAKAMLPRLLSAASWAIVIACARIGRYATWYRFRRGKVRSLWGVTPILTLPLKARCDRLLGIQSDSVVFVTYLIYRQFDIDLSGLLARFIGMEAAFYRLVLAWAMLKYDTFNYFYDRGIIPTASIGVDGTEMALLKRAGKRVYFYAYGADVRTRETTLALGKWNCCTECDKPGRYCICSDDRAGKNLATISPAATAMISMGDMTPYVPGCRNISYWPIDTERLVPVPAASLDGPLRVAHAPNHPMFKGTRFLEAAIKQLQSEGVEIELVTLTGVPNEQVLYLFGQAHVIADQFIIGMHGYTALEAMARGKPVLCFIRSPEMIVAPDECPIINATPETLCAALRWCAAHKEDLAELGRQGRRYVERHHSLSAVAIRLGRLYLGTAGLPPRIEKKVRNRVAQLEEALPVALKGEAPIYCHAEPMRHIR